MKVDFHIDEVVPHAGVMSLLDRVVDFDDDSLQAEVVLGPDSVFAEEKGVPAWVGMEYMAQAIGAYAGVQRRLQGKEVKVGFLVGSRRYESSHAYFPLGSKLLIEVQREFQADNGLGVFNCRIQGDGPDGLQLEASAALNVFQPENVHEFLADSAG